MTCEGCGNPEAHNLRAVMRNGKIIERCEAKNCGDVRVQHEKKTGFAFMDGNNELKLLKKNSNLKLAKQVRQEYAGDASDEQRRRDY